MSNIFSYEPLYDIERLFDEAFFPQFRGGGGQQLQRRGDVVAGAGLEGAVRHLKPRMDLHEDPEKNLVTAIFELPGMNKADVQLNVQNGRLTISAETKQSAEHDERGYAVRERRYGKYSRTLQLPEGVKENEIKAAMENGVLNITFPKTTPDQAPKRISIS